ncbi:alpha/beta hydrolase [Leptospira sp. 201903070]|uniref:Alpha/beta hydrolase n=1 Tax=Leptospira ainlahdjerensis TaxID=2810033 RepID=A0ABS2U8I1_9LEPT|nr:alpha/beta hydrolase [Leptospira ainlahdjerensis]MBM9576686.1 alpha/beta hydrolase [Leptospira ainlahdjerensis]
MKQTMTIFLSILLSFFSLILLLAWWNQDKLIFFPEKLPEDYSFRFPSEFQEIELSTRDGEKTYALYFKAKNNIQNKTILFFHGNAGSLRSWGGISEDFVSLGWNVLISDYRGYGKNTGKLSEDTMYEDGKLWLDHTINKLNIPRKQIVVYGRSIGTGVAVDLVSKNPDLILFLETPFTDLPSLAMNYYPFLRSWMLRFQFENLKKLELINSKIRIFHGTEDEIIPYQNSEIIFEKLKSKKKDVVLYTIQDGTHNDLTVFPEYHQALKKSLDEIR